MQNLFIVGRTGNQVLGTFATKAAAEEHAAKFFAEKPLRHEFDDGMVQFGRRVPGRGIVVEFWVCDATLARRCGWTVA